MTADEIPDEFAKVWQDAQCNLDKLQELAPTDGATAAIADAGDSLDEAKELTAQAQRIASEDRD